MESLLPHISSVEEQTTDFLLREARQKPENTAPLILHFTEILQKMWVRDRQGRQWLVEDKFALSFHELITGKQYKLVRLVEWSIQLSFKKKQCTHMKVVSADAELYSPQQRRRFSACHFSFILASTPFEFDLLSRQLKGFLNRLGKRELCSTSRNIHRPIPSLIRFARRAYSKQQQAHSEGKRQIESLQFWKKPVKEINVMDALTEAGREKLEKLRHFITISELFQFIEKENDLSTQGRKEIERLAKGRERSLKEEREKEKLRERSVKTEISEKRGKESGDQWDKLMW